MVIASDTRAPVAQGIEHWFPEPGVVGSNPAGGTRSFTRAGEGARTDG